MNADDVKRAREICEPLLYQRACTGDNIEDPGLILWRRDYDKLCERIAAAFTVTRAEGVKQAAHWLAPNFPGQARNLMRDLAPSSKDYGASNATATSDNNTSDV